MVSMVTFEIVYRGKWIYWVAQILGWSSFVGLIWVASDNADQAKPGFSTALFIVLVSGVLVTHIYRQVIVAYNWFRYSILFLFPRVLVASFISGVILLAFRLFIQKYILEEPFEDFSISDMLVGIINQAFLVFMWSAIYFMYHYFEKSRQEEIKNLKWEASRNEMELNNLKAQLNPHFMFNSMNSIRALVDENPVQAKQAITQLSTILRNTLLMGRKREISLREELQVVRDYLSLESIRYEERLKVNYQVDEDLLGNSFPPLLLQTIVENAIKHGISKLPKGGQVEIVIQKTGGMLSIVVRNSGVLNHINTDFLNQGEGIGLTNALKRLQLLYGKDASLQLRENNGMVEAIIVLPIIKAYESDSGG
jgi:sensor histidine kinase YesM